jgi:hypothetical protein
VDRKPKSGRYCTRVAAMILAGAEHILAAAPSAAEDSHAIARHAPIRRWVILAAAAVLGVGLATTTSVYAGTYVVDNGPPALQLNAEPTTYTFRVALPDNRSVGYPYAAGSSNTVVQP